MITDYFVCSGSSLQELQDNVKISIQKGWQPLGGVAVAVNVEWEETRLVAVEDQRQFLCQAVVKTSSD